MSRFIRRSGEGAEQFSTTSGFSGSYFTQDSGVFTIPQGTTVAKITAIGGGGGGATVMSGCIWEVSSGAGGGTVISYVNVSGGDLLYYNIGSGGSSISSCCTVSGTSGGTTIAYTDNFAIYAYGGGGGTSSVCYCCSTCVSSGGLGCATGTVSCIIIPGGSGTLGRSATTCVNYCTVPQRGVLQMIGGNTFMGFGSVGSPIICLGSLCWTSSCATYGGGGIAGCCYLMSRPGAPGLLYIEYN